MTSSRTLVKSDKVFQKDSPKVSQNIHPKETFMNSFLQLPHSLELH